MNTEQKLVKITNEVTEKGGGIIVLMCMPGEEMLSICNSLTPQHSINMLIRLRSITNMLWDQLERVTEGEKKDE